MLILNQKCKSKAVSPHTIRINTVREEAGSPVVRTPSFTKGAGLSLGAGGELRPCMLHGVAKTKKKTNAEGEIHELLCTVCAMVKQCNHCEKQYGGSSKN